MKAESALIFLLFLFQQVIEVSWADADKSHVPVPPASCVQPTGTTPETKSTNALKTQISRICVAVDLGETSESKGKVEKYLEDSSRLWNSVYDSSQFFLKVDPKHVTEKEEIGRGKFKSIKKFLVNGRTLACFKISREKTPNLLLHEAKISQSIRFQGFSKGYSHRFEGIAEPIGMIKLDTNTLLHCSKYYRGGNLARFVNSLDRLSSKEIFQIARQGCSAVNQFHQAGIVHNDIKPANFVIEKRTQKTGIQVKLTDFGQAYAANQPMDLDFDPKTTTSNYESSEFYSGKTQASPSILFRLAKRKDHYALAMTLLNLALGRKAPWQDSPFGPVRVTEEKLQGEVTSAIRELGGSAKTFDLKNLERWMSCALGITSQGACNPDILCKQIPK